MSLHKKHIIALVLLCIAIFIVNLDALPINIMEARNFITAREMLVDNNWILTTINGQARYEKPPLPTWLTAISASIFGFKYVFTLRLPAAIITMFLVVYSYKLVEKIVSNTQQAYIAALILSTSFYIVFAGRNGQWDIFTHGFMILSIYHLYLILTQSTKNLWRAVLAGIFFGCSVLSKGPVAVYTLFIPFLIAYGVIFKFNNFRSKYTSLSLFIFVSALLSLSWYGYTYIVDYEQMAAISKQEANHWGGNNVRPFYYYWSFFIQSGLWTIPAFISLLYPYLKHRVIHKKAYQFTLIWTLASLFLLSIIPEKKSRYLLPVLIPLALNTSFYIEYILRKFLNLKDWRETFPVYFNFGLVAIILLIFPFAGYFLFKDSIVNLDWIWFALLSITVFLIGLFILKNLIKKDIKTVFYSTIAMIIAVISFGLPLVSIFNTNEHYSDMAVVKQMVAKKSLTIYDYEEFTPEMVWDYGAPILETNCVIPPISNQPIGILVERHRVKEFKDTFKDYKIEQQLEVDMNTKPFSASGYKSRLHRVFYIVSPL